MGKEKHKKADYSADFEKLWSKLMLLDIDN